MDSQHRQRKVIVLGIYNDDPRTLRVVLAGQSTHEWRPIDSRLVHFLCFDLSEEPLNGPQSPDDQRR